MKEVMSHKICIITKLSIYVVEVEHYRMQKFCLKFANLLLLNYLM